MRAPVKLGLFALLLAAVFAVAAVAGSAVEPEGAKEETTAAGHDQGANGERRHGGDDEGEAHDAPATSSTALPGLAVAQDGHRLVLDQDRLARSSAARLRLRIVDDEGTPVRDFETNHDKRMHVVVVRRDLGTFEHLHPTMAPDGTWETAVDLSAPGTYRVFADFTRDGEQRTLGADLQVPGAYAPRALPAAAGTATTEDGLTVRRTRDGATTAFRVLRGGTDVTGELEPYLGAKGHLVTLRAADLAYLHTHPEGDRLAFEVDLPTAGAYRSWVQFKLDGVVRTAAFTEEVTA